MKDVLADIDSWGDARVALATVVDVKRSAPRPPGAKMAISERGDVSGAVSGGCVEGAVVEAAEEVLAGAPPRLVRYGIADEEAWDVGLPCGGEIGVWIQADPHPGFADLARADGRGALVTDLDSDAGYIGAMGSRRAQAARRERLLALGVTEEALERIAAPIGLDLGALTAEETALSIMSEIVAVRHGHGGSRLRDAAGRIHNVG
jgi:xanthine dehydrogenase accessory factor